MDIIILKNIRIYAFHGCLQEEQRIGSDYIIDLKIYLDLKKAAQSDELSDTVNYQSFYQTVLEQMQISSYLIENVAYRILSRILERHFFIYKARIKLCKLNPPVGGEIEKVCVFMKQYRGNILKKCLPS